MYVFITVLILIAAVCLILIVLVQNSKGGGLASSFASSNQIMGAPKTADFLEKATWTLAGIVIVLSIVAAAFLPNRNLGATSEIKDAINTEIPAARLCRNDAAFFIIFSDNNPTFQSTIMERKTSYTVHYHSECRASGMKKSLTKYLSF